MEKNKSMSFDDMLKVNVNSFTEKKGGLTYLSWANAWTEFKKCYPMATYKVIKTDAGKPYFKDESLGIMCHTEVTVPQINNGADLTYEMWLPVMDFRNKAMVNTATMFDINKTIMRCLVKNLAMFGLGLYIYSGEDLPEDSKPSIKKAVKPSLLDKDFDRAIETIKEGKYSSNELESRFNLSPEQQKTIINLKSGKNGK